MLDIKTNDNLLIDKCVFCCVQLKLDKLERPFWEYPPQ